MSSEIKWTAGTGRSTGIAAQGVAAGANFLGSEIDNAAHKDRFATLDVLLGFTVAPSAGKTMEVYLLYAADGTNYEDGSAAVDPPANPVGVFPVRNVTGNQRMSLCGVPLEPFRFKILCKSELDQTATATVLCYTHNEEVQ